MFYLCISAIIGKLIYYRVIDSNFDLYNYN